MKHCVVTLLLFCIIGNANAQNYLSFNDCIDLYVRGLYEEIYPSLEHIRDEMEDDSLFDAETYSVVVILLSRIEMDSFGNGIKAGQTLEKAYKTLKTNVGNTTETRIIITKVAECYRIMRQLGKAKAYLMRAEELFEEAGDFGEYYLTLVVQNAIYYYLLDDKDMMKKSVDKTIKIYDNLYGDIFSSKDYKGLNILNNLALIYNDLGDTQKSEKCYNSIIDNLNVTDVMANSLHSEACNALAVIKMQQNKWQEAMDILMKMKWYQDYNNNVYIQNFLTCSLFLGDKEKITRFFGLFDLTMLMTMPRIFFRTNEENYNYVWYENIKNIEFYNFAAYKSNLSEIVKSSYLSTAFFKTISLQSSRLLNEYVRKSDDEQLKSDYYQSQELKHKYIFGRETFEEQMQDYTEYERLFDSVLTKIPNLSNEIIKKINAFAESKDVLYENEYVVEFCLIPVYDSVPHHTDYFGAYILGKHYSAPKLIKLAETTTIKELLTPSNDEMEFYSKLYSDEINNNLYNLIFKPLDIFLKDAKTVYYSPYGILSTINFDVLTDNNGFNLSQKYKLVRVSSSADIYSVRSRNLAASGSAELVGNINYDTAFYDTSRGYTFGKLHHSGKEIQSIINILKQHNFSTTLLENKDANEQAVKQLSGKSPEILHFATHGFCLDTEEKAANKPFAKNINTYSQKESAMVLCGLALSGANNVWKGKNALPNNVEDGILTAYEISQLDLSNTKLVVLSACETARGKIFPVDGVFGLQRAFKQAGAGAILMSLWKVDDGVTAIFMQHFYKFLFETNDRHKALKLAQDEVKKQFPDPYYWAAWVMLD